MAFNYDKLGGNIVEVFGTRYKFAEAMEWSEPTLSLKNNDSQMVEKKLADLLKDIRRYNSQLSEGKIPSGDFFKVSTYLDVNGQERPCMKGYSIRLFAK